MRFPSFYVAALLMGAAVPAALGDPCGSSLPHATDFWVARSAANQMKLANALGGFNPLNTAIVFVPPTPDGPQWLSSDNGWDSLQCDSDATDSYPMLSGSDIYLVIDAIEPGMRLQYGPPFALIIAKQPGDQMPLGNELLHRHVTCVIDSTQPGYVAKSHYSMTLHLTDHSGQQSDSAPILVHFTSCQACGGDANFDCSVDLSDLGTLLAHYGKSGGATVSDGDLNGDGNVDLSDLGVLLAAYGEICP